MPHFETTGGGFAQFRNQMMNPAEPAASAGNDAVQEELSAAVIESPAAALENQAVEPAAASSSESADVTATQNDTGKNKEEKARRGRPPKNPGTAASAEKTREKNIRTPKDTTTIYFPAKDLKMLRLYRVLNGNRPLSDIVAGNTHDFLYHQYQCSSPACGASFCMVSKDGEAPKPACCPVCGGQKTRHQKMQMEF